MARSGDFGTSNQYIKYYIEAIQNWQDVAGNLSNVTVRVWVYRTNNYTTWGNGTVSVTINGGSYSASITTSQKITTTPIVVFERNLNIGHNADGTGYVDVSAMISHNSPFSSGWNGWRMGLTTIPRASQPSLSNANVPMGTTITIYMNRKSTAFTHTVKYVFGNQSGTIATGVTDQVNWTVPMSLANAIPDATAGWGGITVETYNGGSYIGSASVRFDASVPDSVKPTIDNVVISEKNERVKALNIGSYVQNFSWLYVEVWSKSQYSAGISSTKVTFDNFTYNNWIFETNVIKNSGALTMNIEVTDTRGRKTTKTITGINVLAYSPPRITEFKVDRANSNGTLNELGTYVKVTRTASVSSLKVGTTEKNTLTYTIKSKPKSSSTWTTNVSATTLATGVTTLTGSNTIGTFDATQSYDLRIEVSDKFNTAISIGTISTGQVTMSWGKYGVGIGKIWERGALDVAGDAYINDALILTQHQVNVPIGKDYSTIADVEPKAGYNDVKLKLTIGGTTSYTVVSSVIDIISHHSNQVHIKSFSGGYTTLTVRVSVGEVNNGSISIQVKTNSDYTPTLTCGIIAYGGEKVTMYTNNPTPKYNAYSIEHTCLPADYSITTTKDIRSNSYPDVLDRGHLARKQDVLWTGSALMGSGQVVYPAKKLSDCNQGWMLVWSEFGSSGATEYAYQYSFIPKDYLRTPALSMQFWLTGYGTSFRKILYVYNDAIGGDGGNSVNPSSQVTLRRVVEW